MSIVELEDIIYNNYFKDYDKQEIYNILLELNKNTYKNENEFNKTVRRIIKGKKKMPGKAILSTCYQELKKLNRININLNLEKLMQEYMIV